MKITKCPWKQLKDVREHVERTGEQAAKASGGYARPVQIGTHGGYMVARSKHDPIALAGPFAWIENAQQSARQHGAIVVRQVDMEKLLRERGKSAILLQRSKAA